MMIFKSSKPMRAAVGIVAAAALLIGYQVAAPPPAVAADPVHTLSADPLPTVQVNGIVYAQAVAGNRVFAGGEFTQARPAGAAAGVQQTARANLLAYNLQTGVLEGSFAPQVNGRIMAATVSPDGSTLYIGGSFTSVNGQSRFRLAAFNTSTGALTSWAPAANSTVYSIAATSAAVYVAGQYTAVNNTTRTGVAAISASNGTLRPFNPVHEGGYLARAVVVSPDGTKVIAAGSFLTTNGQSSPGRGMAALDATTGASLPWAVNSVIRNAGNNAAIYSLSSDATSVYGTGYDFGGSRTLDNFEGAFRASWGDGTMVWMQDCHGDTYSVAPHNGTVYTATHSHYCGNIGEFPQVEPWSFNHSLAFAAQPSGRAITPDIHGYRSFTGNPGAKLLHWYPKWTPGTYSGLSQAAWSVASSGNYVLYGGEFTAIDGTRQQGLVRFATRDIAPNKVGPRIQGSAWRINPISYRPAEARITWQANHDPDNAELTYQLFREGVAAPLHTETAASTLWVRPTMRFTDTGVQSGQTHRYRIRATDANGNTTQSDWAPVTIATASSTPSYLREVLDDGPRHYWPLGEPSGTTGVDWAGPDSLTLTGASRTADGQALDGSTNATVFAGATTSFASSGTPQAGPQTYSVEAWFRTTSTTGGKIVGFGNRATGSSNSYDRQIYLSGSGIITFGNRVGQPRVVQSGAGFNDGKWHHVVGTLGSAGMTLWVDGVQVATRADTTSAQVNFGYWRVGGDGLSTAWPNVTSAYLGGSIADVAVYDRVLTGADIDAHIVASGRPSSSGAPPNAAPTSSFTLSSTGLSISADGRASSDPDGTIASYAWSFGDGATATGATATHTYATGGTRTVTLAVTDSRGATATSSQQVTVTATATNQAPTASFTSTTQGMTASVDGRASSDPDGTIASYAWTFGDGTTATGATASRTYTAAGTYTVTLRVVDNAGASATTTRSVTVQQPAPVTALARDTFTRTATGAWGTPDVGPAWTPFYGSAAFSVSGGQGRIALAPSHTREARMTTLSQTAAEVAVSFSSDVASAGAAASITVVGRQVGSEVYATRVRLEPGGVVRVYLLYNETSLGSFVLPQSYTAGAVVHVRMLVDGTGPTRLAASVWLAGTAQPASWMLDTTHSAAAMQTAGSVGVRAALSSASTVPTQTIRFDDWEVRALR
ncbi:MAG: PKD domain-containing protein [Actinomycetota bacterium]